MKYRLIEYKTNEIGKLRITSIQFYEVFKYLSMNSNRFKNNLSTYIYEAIKDCDRNSAPLNITLNFQYFQYVNLGLEFKLTYNETDKIFTLTSSNENLILDAIDIYKIKNEVFNIKDKLKEIKTPDLIEFILSYIKGDK